MKSRKLINDDYVIENGQFVMTGGAVEVAQSVDSRLKLMLGEYFLDLDDGLPLLQEILTKPVNLARVELLIKQRIADTPEVKQLTNFAVNYDAELRKLTVIFQAETIFDEAINEQTGINFNV